MKQGSSINQYPLHNAKARILLNFHVMQAIFKTKLNVMKLTKLQIYTKQTDRVLFTAAVTWLRSVPMTCVHWILL